MDLTKIHRLIDKALEGDKAALNELVEWAEREAIAQELAHAPAGLRAEVLQGLDALHKARRDRANRQAAIIKRNKERGEAVRAPIRKALGNAALHDKKMCDLVKIIIKYLTRNGVLESYGLKDCPCEEVIEREIRKMRGENATE